MTVSCVTGRAIGGFLPLETEREPSASGVLALWGVTSSNCWAFANARSALAHLLRSARSPRLLLPAFICPELAQAAMDNVTIAFYPLTATLSPDIDSLSAVLRPEDCVVAVDYFGRPPDADFRALVAARPDILWVEDRAQALFPATAPWADWVLYSPRKLFGVPDGGLMVHMSGSVLPASHSGSVGENRVYPRVMRRDDNEERDNARWYAAYQQVEARMAVSREPMSALTRRLLDGVDPQTVIRRRQENFDVLANLLRDIAFFDGTAAVFAPFGFPVRLSDRDSVWRALIERRIFAARFWPVLPSDPAAFPDEHALSREILILPCDQRYGADDMRVVADAFRSLRT